LWEKTLTILLRASAFGGGFRGYDALSCLFGNGDHEVVDLLEVEVCHFELNYDAKKQTR
jgi:hypothetical protein